MGRINEKFDADLKRFRELASGRKKRIFLIPDWAYFRMAQNLRWMQHCFHPIFALTRSLSLSLRAALADGYFQQGGKMLNQSCSNASRAPAPAEENPAPDAFESTVIADFYRLSGEEIERLIALCAAPALLWRSDTAPARAPEPFGMIA